MPLRRSGSARSTLSVLQRRTTKYQQVLNLANVFLLVTSTILLFSAAILMKFYHLAKLDFWSAYFSIVPTLMIALGVFTFVVCVFGFFVSGSERRLLLALYAILLCVAFVAQLASIFTSLELRTTIAQGNVGASAVTDDLSRFGVESSVSEKWDSLQEDLHCCGGNNFLTGYQDYRNTPIGANNSVPDSCCHTITPNCGQNMLLKQDEVVRNFIFVDGCLTLLRSKLERDVVPMMILYAIVGVVLAIVELVAVALAFSYIAQINRKKKREEKMWRATTNQPVDVDEAARLNHETVC